jgi:nitronate monooxygenase
MLRTHLTEQWDLRYPILGAPMAGTADGKLARAVTQAGGLGQVGIGSETPVEYLEEETAIARGDDDARFGIGLMIWALERRPELFEAAVAARPFLLSMSFGSPAPYVERAHAAGIKVATQVNTVAAAREAAAAGVDLVVAQGTEAGGHTGAVSTLPLLQGVLEAVGDTVPVVAAGGIATARGLAAVLAAGAQGAWIGTALLASTEAGNTPAVRQRVIAATEADTIHTHTFDDVTRTPWPDQYPGRALRNRFAEAWHGRSKDLTEEAFAEYGHARSRGDFDVAVIYAGEASGLVQRERSTTEILQELGQEAEALLRRRSADLLG